MPIYDPFSLVKAVYPGHVTDVRSCFSMLRKGFHEH